MVNQRRCHASIDFQFATLIIVFGPAGATLRELERRYALRTPCVLASQ